MSNLLWKNSLALHLFKLTNPLHLLYLLHLLSLQPIYNKLEKRQLGFPNNKLPKRNKWPKIGLMQNFQVMNLKSIKLWTISFPSNPPNPPNLLHLLLKQSKWQSRLDWWWSPWFEKPLYSQMILLQDYRQISKMRSYITDNNSISEFLSFILTFIF